MFIACATDRNYVEMTGVLIRSIACQKHVVPVEIIVFCTRLRPVDKSDLLACSDAGTAVSFIDVEKRELEALESFGSARHLSMVTYLRLMIPDLIPDRRGRLIYLDCDIVVNASLDPLFQLDLEGHPVAAVPNAASAGRLSILNQAIGRSGQEPYFNAGVLIIDLDGWRRDGIGRKCIDFVGIHGKPLDADQAILNGVLTSNWKAVEAKWNANPKRYSPDQAKLMPIQHFWSGKKPFYAEYPILLRERYDHFRSMTPWASARRSTRLQRSIRKRWRSMRSILQVIRAR